ncbi:MAG: hypothetical protein Q9166_003148 [cf. Caloplaca sp. 2 TL-2023]
MGTYTKIFLQFPPDRVFWNTSYQFLLYADPHERGYYPVFQSLDTEGFLPGSGIIFVTLVQSQSYVVEAQDDQTTKDQVLAVLRNMFGAENVPEPIAFMYPRWSLEPWALGSYSNWPPGTTLEMHQNLRANVGRLYFAGEATSAQYFGFLHGAWYEGQAIGEKIAGMIKNTNQSEDLHYETLHGTTSESEYNATNGFILETTFLTYGFDNVDNIAEDIRNTSTSMDQQPHINSCKSTYTGPLRFLDTEPLASAATPLRKIARSTKIAALNQASANVAAHLHPLRCHPKVMDFANHPASRVIDTTIAKLRPIEDLPADLSARVKFLGNDHWIIKGHDEEDGSVEAEYVVIKKEMEAVDTTTSEETIGGWMRSLVVDRSFRKVFEDSIKPSSTLNSSSSISSFTHPSYFL